MNERLLPLETLYKERKKKDNSKKTVPFYKPGVSNSKPQKNTEQLSLRFLQASMIKNELGSLENPLNEIEGDAKFVTKAMTSALQVPGAIESTFNRIHGRIYDIQREIEYNSNSLDEKALVIQSSFRKHSSQQHFKVIMNAINNTIKRDCAPIHESLLGFLLSYMKREDHMRLRMNRRFIFRNRFALKYWRDWSVKSREATEERVAKIPALNELWLKRQVSFLLKKWRDLSFSKHSRKSVRQLQIRITAEAQKRLSDRTSKVDSSNLNFSILELLALERESVIIDFGKENYRVHLLHVSFVHWNKFVEQCKKESRSGNAIAKEHYINRTKKTFFNAWFSLSVGRIVVFGGYSRWNKPFNRRKVQYEENSQFLHLMILEWRNVCIKQVKLQKFIQSREVAFLRKCLIGFHEAASKRRERLSHMMEIYISLLRQRMHRVFVSWHHIVVKEKVRKHPNEFLLKRSLIMRKYRTMRRFFRKWRVKYGKHSNERFNNDLEEVDMFVNNWEQAGSEMKESMVLISQLKEKLTTELNRRKNDLDKSNKTIEFMKNEQKSLSSAMRNSKAEIEKLHEIIGKSSMRYFIDIKTVHKHVVEDVPGALQQYIQQKEEEKQRMIAEKAAAAAAITNTKTIKNNPSVPKRRKTVFQNGTNKLQITTNRSKAKKSLDSPFTDL